MPSRFLLQLSELGQSLEEPHASQARQLQPRKPTKLVSQFNGEFARLPSIGSRQLSSNNGLPDRSCTAYPNIRYNQRLLVRSKT